MGAFDAQSKMLRITILFKYHAPVCFTRPQNRPPTAFIFFFPLILWILRLPDLLVSFIITVNDMNE